MAVRDKKLINNTNAHMAVDDLLNSEIISEETRQTLKKMKATLETESQELMDDFNDDTGSNSQAAD